MATNDQADLTNLLRWSIENSAVTRDDPTAVQPTNSRSGLDQEALRRLMLGGPSDADRMQEAMAAIQSPETSLQNKTTAFDNLEQLVEQIDNANNMESLGLWTPLVELLKSEEGEIRMWAAWVMATAVSNNVKAQERLLVLDAIPTLVAQATEDTSLDARKKAILALSSGMRNYQPSVDKAVETLPEQFLPAGKKLDAGDMEAIDGVISSLRAESAKKG